MNNVFDQDPPFVHGAFQDGYDQFTATYPWGEPGNAGIGQAV